MSGISSPAAAAAGDGIVRAFSRLVAQGSTRTIVATPGRQATVGDVDALSIAIVDQFRTARLHPGGLVGLAAPNGPAFLAGLLALRRANQAVLLLDALAPREERRRACEVLGVTAELECRDVWPTSDAAFRLTPTGVPATSRVVPEVAVVKLTSGSTGAPRGVVMRAEQVLADEAALAATMGLHDEDRLLAGVPFSHSYGFTTLALSALVRGLTLVIPADRGPFSLLSAARDLGATVFPTVPAYIQALLRLSPPPAWPASIRLVISAGALLPAAAAAQFRRTYGQPVHVFYGSSECGGICYDREGGAAERGTVGTPVDGVRVSLAPARPGTAGEGLVVVESPAVGDSYLPERDNRLCAGRFETSDLAVWDGAEVALRRRVDRVINVRGWKVDPSEVEMVLSEFEGVSEVVVLGMPSQGGSDEIVRAVVACTSRRPSYRELTAWCRHRLADHKVPRSIEFVDTIPRTPRGKIDRTALLRIPTVPGRDLDPERRTPPIFLATAGVHGTALAIVVAFPRSWKLMLTTLVGNYVVLSLAGLIPRSSWLGPNITRLPPACAEGGIVALTFDDGPDPEVTPKVLDLLAQAKATATFFCVGRRVEAHPDIVADIRARGHGVENHTYSHPNSFAFRGRRGLRQEIQRAQTAIEQSGGGCPTFFRAPAGIQNPLLSAVLAGSGLSLVSWTRRGFDTVTADGARVARRLARGLRGGDILLLHDASSARDLKGQAVVLDALPRVLDEMSRKGLRSQALHSTLKIS